MTKPMPKWLFYLLSWTWGIIMTLIGHAAAGILLLLGHRPQKNIYGWTFVIGENWGGVDLGYISIVQHNPTQHLLNHEFGHSIQNCYFGPFFPFIVAIPSMIRYWYREFKYRKNPTVKLPDYDVIWFEGTATSLGNFYKANTQEKDMG